MAFSDGVDIRSYASLQRATREGEVEREREREREKGGGAERREESSQPVP
jgi:hypothetical protein